MRFGLDNKSVPGQFRDKIQEYVDGYELYDHVLQGGRNPKRIEDLGLTDYAMDRYALACNAKDWIERISAIADAGGTNIWFSAEPGADRKANPLHENVRAGRSAGVCLGAGQPSP